MPRSSTSGQGRPKGAPNKATADARRAIASFVDDNAGRLQGWLNQIADGVKHEETGEFIVSPNPEKAFNLFQSVIEYHVPKLARTVVAGDPENPLHVEATVRNKVEIDFSDIVLGAKGEK